MTDPYVVSAAGAAWDAAHAAWASVVVNALVVASAFFLQWNQARIDRNRAREAESALQKSAGNIALKSIRVMQVVQAASVDGVELSSADALATVRVHRLMIQHYIDRDPDPISLLEILHSHADIFGQFEERLAEAQDHKLTKENQTLAGACLARLRRDEQDLKAFA